MLRESVFPFTMEVQAEFRQPLIKYIIKVIPDLDRNLSLTTFKVPSPLKSCDSNPVNCDVEEDSWKSLGLQDQTSQS